MRGDRVLVDRFPVPTEDGSHESATPSGSPEVAVTSPAGASTSSSPASDTASPGDSGTASSTVADRKPERYHHEQRHRDGIGHG